jgi:8-oxo-dGTP pyrophosphatase MutT (NUDIX family)
MQREFEEEVGILVPLAKWRHVARMGGPCWEVEVFSTFLEDLSKAVKKTEETPEVFTVDDLPVGRMIDNLIWLIPLSLSVIRGTGPNQVEIVY